MNIKKILILSLAFLFLQCEKTPEQHYKAIIDDIEEYRKGCPITVQQDGDRKLVIDSIEIGINRKVTYHIKFVGLHKNQLSNEQLNSLNEQIPNFKRQGVELIKNKDTRIVTSMKKANVTIHYKMNDENGIFLLEYVITPNDL